MIIAIRFPTYCKTHYRLFSLCVIPLLHARFAGGSCWAFSTAETWEDNACILGINGVNNETTFSTEDLLACATFGSGQCGGGRINYAFDYVVSDGLVDEKCFPYTSQNGTVSQSLTNETLQSKKKILNLKKSGINH